ENASNRRARGAVRYEDFVRKPADRPRWVLPVVTSTVLLGAAGAVVAFMMLGNPLEAERAPAPAALSSAGKPVAGEAYQWKRVAIGGGGMISGLSMSPGGETFV